MGNYAMSRRERFQPKSRSDHLQITQNNTKESQAGKIGTLQDIA